jgi:hypothetical protein
MRYLNTSMEQEKQTGVFKGKTKETIEGQKKEKS